MVFLTLKKRFKNSSASSQKSKSMLKKLILFISIAACSLPLKAQSDTLSLSATLLPPYDLAKWHIPPGNYSGITPIGNNRYAVVTDKAKSNGFYEFEILLSDKGEVTSVRNIGFHSDSTNTTPRDMEGIIYNPNSNTVFISAESDQQIIEYTLDGQQTGRQLNIPDEFSINNIQPNYGFEALAYSPETNLFWTTTENALRPDKHKRNVSTQAKANGATLRIQAFTEDLQPSIQFNYVTDSPIKFDSKHKFYAFGVPAITALPDGTLLILERELYIPHNYLGSFVNMKIYRTTSSAINQQKTLITEFKTSLHNLANYEGMCLGPELPDGTQTLLLICDSQDRYGNSFYHLKDKIMVIKIKQKRQKDT